MKDYYLHNTNGYVKLSQDNKTKDIQITLDHNKPQTFTPENLLKQLEHLTEYIKRYGN